MRFIFALSAVLVIFAAQASAESGNKEERIKIAVSAAPDFVSANATVMEWDKTILRPGTNDYYCFPTLPNGDPHPTCIDETWIRIYESLGAKKAPPKPEKISVGYWLQGATSGKSNESPFAFGDAAAGHALVTGEPHIALVVPDTAAIEAVTTDPNSGGPWVMYKGTPWVHLMIPASPQ